MTKTKKAKKQKRVLAPENNLAMYREKLGLSQAEFAPLCGLHKQTLCRIEVRRHAPYGHTKRAVVEALNNAGSRRQKKKLLTLDDVFPG